MLFNPTQMHQCARGKFLRAFFLFFFSVKLYLLMNHGSMRDVSSGLMTLLSVSTGKPGCVVILVKLSFTC